MILVLWFACNALDWHVRLGEDKKLVRDLDFVLKEIDAVYNEFVYFDWDKITEQVDST
jgi:hypothetical protein